MIQTQDIQPLKQSDFRGFRELIYRESGISLDDCKQILLQSRLQKRLRALEIGSYSAYFEYLQHSDPKGVELQRMINRVTTNKTHFFREEHHFEYLRDVVFRSLIDSAKRGEGPKRLRIWSAACSTGEEPYTLAMTVRETFATLPDWDIKILASDIDTDVLQQAQAGVYHSDAVEDIDPHRVKQHFLRGANKNAQQVMVRPELRDLIAFRQINFADEDWPIHTKFDAIFCRNVLIYFDEVTQDQLVRRLVDYLKPAGRLFIGHSESLLQASDVYHRCGPTVFELTDVARRNLAQYADNQHVNASPSFVQGSKHVAEDKGSPTADVETPANGTPSAANPNMQRIIVGDVFASETPTVVTTTLGSCIATCLYDEVSRIGGMNHFALPTGKGNARLKSSYGVHAMELLINQILGLGGAKKRLKAKIFGAANTALGDASHIGSDNEAFVREFLATERIPLHAEYLGGDSGMQVIFETATGRARVKLLDQESALQADEQQKLVQMPESDITLF